MNIPENIPMPRRRSQADIRLDANESPFNMPDSQYPDADMLDLRERWGLHERIPAQCIYLTSGTEEAVDLAMRIYAVYGRDSVLSVEPTRSVYRRRAMINRLEYRQVKLKDETFALDVEALLDAVSATTKMIFLCSPNSPTGNVLDKERLADVLELFDGMVVVDESYIDYAPEFTCLELLNRYRNLIILRSFSHAWSLAGIRLAAVVARPEVTEGFRRIGWAHPVSSLTEREVLQMLPRRLDVDKWVRQTANERVKVEVALKELPECVKVYPSLANFVLVRFVDTMAVYKYLLANGIAVYPVCGCLRITIGLPWQNSALLGALRRRVG